MDDVYCQTLHNKDKVYYAELIQQGYVIKGPENENTLLCNVAVTAEKSRQLFDTIYEELSAELGNLCRPIRENISRIVRATLSELLKAYTKGYTETWISFYAR